MICTQTTTYLLSNGRERGFDARRQRPHRRSKRAHADPRPTRLRQLLGVFALLFGHSAPVDKLQRRQMRYEKVVKLLYIGAERVAREVERAQGGAVAQRGNDVMIHFAETQCEAVVTQVAVLQCWQTGQVRETAVN